MRNCALEMKEGPSGSQHEAYVKRRGLFGRFLTRLWRESMRSSLIRRQIRRELFLDRDDGEELAAYAMWLLEQLDFMVDRLDTQREGLRKVVASP